MNKKYRQQVELLLKIIPELADIECFVIHGGTAINFYVLDMPRYSVDIDVTYTPIKPREESFFEIYKNLKVIKERINSVISNVIVSEKPNKIYFSQKGIMVKVEVSGTKRGLIEPYEVKALCKKAQNEFETEKLIDFINSGLTDQDKEFLIAFEKGNNLLQFFEYQEYLQFPSIQWKIHNINKLRKSNPTKHGENVKKLEKYF